VGDIVIVAYRPKAGCEARLLDLANEHVPFLRRLGLATDRPSVVARGADGVVVEVFEWAEGAIAKAHQMPEVKAMWERYADVCDYAPLNTLSEANDLFAQFKPIS